jgi:hypothetical protein
MLQIFEVNPTLDRLEFLLIVFVDAVSGIVKQVYVHTQT